MKLFYSLITLASFVAPSHALTPTKLFTLDEIDPKATLSIYSAQLSKLLAVWPPATASLKDQRPDIIRAIETPGSPHLIGMVKHSIIQAPLARVVEVSEGFGDYPKIWKDTLETEVVSKTENRTLVRFVRSRPTFFLPRIQFRTLYVSDKSKPDQVVYRQQLMDGNMVKSTDALVVLDRLSPDQTRVTVYNFFDPDLGMANLVASGTIWRSSIEAGFKDDLAFKAKAEHSDWSLDQINTEVDRVYKLYPIEKVEYTPLPDVLRPLPQATPGTP